MKINNRFVFTLLTIFMVFAYSAMSTVPAYADEGTPPEDTSIPEVQPEVEPSQPVDSVPSEAIAQLPEGTNVVVLDESNNSVPLATQEAAQTLVDGDPIWCPTGVAPKGGTGGCSPVFNHFGFSGDSGSLIDWLVSNQQNKAGTIWVEHNYDDPAVETAPDIILSGADYTTMDNFALTIQGGWNGTPLSKLLYTADPYSYFNSTLSINGWTGAITLNNIVMDGVTTTYAGEGATSLYIDTKGNIVLNNVTVNNSYNLDDSDPDYLMNGASLSNDGTGTVTINNSEFSNNEGNGLFVLSAGAITTNGLIASFNGGLGAGLVNDWMLTQGKPITLKGFKQFNNNGGDGLLVISRGLITLSNVVANNNIGNGIYLDNTYSTANLGVTLSGTNYAMNNGGAGMVLLSHGAITASNLNASGNDGAGAWLDNCDYNGSDCDLILAKPVKLTGVNVFNGNGTVDEGGLLIRSIGAITVSNLTASDNLGVGAEIDNQWTNFNGAFATGTWTLTGYGNFQNNSLDGLQGWSFGNAVLNNIDASYNGGDGLNMDVYKLTGGSGITLNGINQFSDNDEYGLSLWASGQITINNVTANRNLLRGAYIGNLYDPIKPFNVTMKGTNTFKDNGEDGLFVESFGSILVNNLTASGNGAGASTGSGVILDNCVWSGSFCNTATPKAVTVTGYVNASNNFVDGLHVESTGAVTLNNILAEWNGFQGVGIWNDVDPTKALAVTLKGSNTFNSNVFNGLEVHSYGAITANNITAFENGQAGVVLINTGGVTPKNITLTGVNAFVGNYMDGLFFDASGSAILSRVNADGNDWDAFDDSYIGNGITGTAGGSMVLSCIYVTNQANGAGYNLVAGTTITIKGLYSAFNNMDNVPLLPSATVIITKPCALP